MNRPRTIWLIFGACLAVVLVATGWVSWTALRLDRLRAQSEQASATEEKIRLALWRMESMLAPLIAQESVRPSYVYNAYYSADRSYGKMFNPADRGETRVPSPLLGQVSSNILLHFQINPDGRLTSPESPEGAERELALKQPGWRTPMEKASLRLGELEKLLSRDAAGQAGKAPSGNRDLLFAAAPKPILTDNNLFNAYSQGQMPALQINQAAPSQVAAAAPQGPQIVGNQRELQARAQSVQQAFDLNVRNGGANTVPAPNANVNQGPFGSVWLNGTFVLARRVVAGRQEYLQGCWLDWPGMQRWLLESIKDLFPNATLVPIAQESGDDSQARILASLPVRLVPGLDQAYASGVSSPVVLVLAVVWACMILATLAVAVLLHGVIGLSERRAMFVSAVSHELRTPLTTFKMYSEMLAEGMVPDESARLHYLRTLCSEANRLGHLVENVLAYARLERGSARARVEEIALGGLLERIQPRLDERAGQAGLRIVQEASAEALGVRLRIDVTAVEQILFNLIDNACKYAPAAGADSTIHLEAESSERGFVLIRVRDQGPGLSAEAVRRLFRPFGKSAQEAAKEQPGVGLGLALCLRLSRSLGGDLRMLDTKGHGACFELRLPALKAVE